MDSDTSRTKLKAAETLGISAAFTHAPLQTDCFKELINKLAWTLGSVYRKPYSGTKSPARTYALEIARVVIQEHGWPMKIGVLEPPTD